MPILFLRLPWEVQMFRSNKTGQLSTAEKKQCFWCRQDLCANLFAGSG